MAATFAPDTMAFVVCLVVIVVDRMGSKFTEPAQFPYSQELGISLPRLSLILAAREVCNLVSNLWMPRAADRGGRKATVLVSIAGSFAAYAIQACAAYAADGFATFLIGKIVAGLFGGTLGLCIAYILELSIPDMALAKKRVSTAMACNMVVPMTMAPIGGAVARFGLNLPFFISAGVAALGFVFCARFMKEVAELGDTDAKDDDDEDGPLVGAPVEEEAVKFEDLENPYKDPVLLLQACCFVPIFVVVISLMLMYSILVSRRCFGLEEDSDEKTREAVAEAAGLIAIPSSTSMILSMTMGYLIVSKRFGDFFCVVVGGGVGGFSWAMHGFCRRLYQVALCGCGFGGGMGLLVGCAMNMSNGYVTLKYPRQIATAKSVAQQGKNLGSIASAPLVVFLVERDRAAAWVLTGLGLWVAAAGLATNLTVMNRAVAAMEAAKLEAKTPPPTATEAQMTLAREKTNALDFDAYVASLGDELRTIFTDGGYDVPLRWNGGAQRWVKRVLRRALPPLRPWTDDDGGAAFIEDLTSLLEAHGEARAIERIRARHAAFRDAGRASLDDWIFAGASAYASGTYASASPDRPLNDPTGAPH
jgi:MFS family permease